jgi:hypothetical protein
MNQSRQGVLGESGFSLMVFVMELRFRKPAVVLTECTQQQDVQFLEENLSDIFDMRSMTVSPGDLGWWCDRRRRFCIFVLHDGPLMVPSDKWSRERFLHLFGRNRPTGSSRRGDMFFAAGKERVQEDLEQTR